MADHINTVATFLAAVDVPDLSQAQPVDCIVLCGSSILHTAECVFKALQERPDLTKSLVICGGIGHSTQLLYDVVGRSPKYRSIHADIVGLSEAEVFSEIMKRYYDLDRITGAGCRILLEKKSTNCGANAMMTCELLRAQRLQPCTVVIVQDATMSLRTLSSFEKAFGNDINPPKLLGCPTFVPEVELSNAKVILTVPKGCASELWSIERFIELIIGEIPRLRDDDKGYGPNGKGFIGHVAIPEHVEAAWSSLVRAYPHHARKF